MKDKLQQELLEKIKPGTKPSDLKKKSKKRLNSPPPMETSKSDSGYESDQSNKSIPTAPALPNSQIKDLQSQITALQKQLKLYQDFKEADLKIKEGYKETIADLEQKNQSLNKTITDLQKQVKTKENIKQQSNEPTETKTFLCSDCKQTKPQSELSRVFGSFSFCLECSKKARKEASQQKETKPNPIDFICHLCEQNKTEIPHLIKLDKTLTEYLICNSCKPTAKEFNEAELITDDLWAKYPYSSASEILELEFGIKSRKE
jgi:hypothetical protein